MLANKDRAASRKDFKDPRLFASSVASVVKSAGHEKRHLKGRKVVERGEVERGVMKERMEAGKQGDGNCHCGALITCPSMIKHSVAGPAARTCHAR